MQGLVFIGAIDLNMSPIGNLVAVEIPIFPACHHRSSVRARRGGGVGGGGGCVCFFLGVWWGGLRAGWVGLA